MQILAAVALLIVSYLFYKFTSFIIKRKEIAAALGKFPMEQKHWFWGHLNSFPGPTITGLEFARKRAFKFPRLCTFWSLNFFKGNLILYHPETVKKLLKTAEPKQITTGSYKYTLSWIGEGLVLSHGSKWMRNRKLLNKVFGIEALREYLKVKNQCTDIFLEKLLLFAQNGESVEMFSNISHLTFDIILRCAFSYESDVQRKGGNHPYLKAVYILQELWAKRCFKPWQHYNFIYWFSKDSTEFRKNVTFVHEVSEYLIRERKKTHELCMERTNTDFLQILLEARDEDGNGLTDCEIRNEVDTFLLAGHDPSSSGVAWTIYALAKNPGEQIRCQKEIDEILKDGKEDALNCNDLHKLNYLTMCIKEALRIYCPIPFVGRELHNPIVIDGVEMPRGSMVSTHIYALHHNPSVWPDSLKYDPSRFSSDNIGNIDPYAYVPFSSGPRNCIGQIFAMNEIKVIVARTLRKFSLALDNERPTIAKPTLALKTENGMFLKISLRQ